MEQKAIQEILERLGISGIEKKSQLLLRYAEMIYNVGQKMNLTGHQSKSVILNELVLHSIIPLVEECVPRGTCFADIGSGQGVPGIPVAIIYNEMDGVLIDSTSRKIAFLNYVIDTLQLNNLHTLCGRVEEIARRDEYREKFDVVYARAMGQMYLVMETGSALVVPGGVLFCYSKTKMSSIEQYILDHGDRLKLAVSDKFSKLNSPGIIFTKSGAVDDIYPRRHAVILREARRREC